MKRLQILIIQFLILNILISLILHSSVASEPVEYSYKVKVGEKKTYIFTKVLFQLNDTEYPAGVFDDNGTLIQYINITIGTKFIIEVINIHMDSGVVEYKTTIIGEEELSREYRIMNPGNLYFLEVTSNRSIYEEMASMDENMTLDGDIFSKKVDTQSQHFEYEVNINTGWIQRFYLYQTHYLNASLTLSEIEYKITTSSITKGYYMVPIMIPLALLVIILRRREFM